MWRFTLVFLSLFAALVDVSSGGVLEGRELLKQLKYHETVTLEHKQFSRADHPTLKPIYPDVGLLNFHAFGRTYKLRVQKNKELFPEGGLKIITHGANSAKGEAPRVHYRTLDDHCHYYGHVLSAKRQQPLDTTSASLSFCRGKGVRGWIHAFNETIVIRPKKLLTHGRLFKGHHSFLDEHIVYRYADVDRGHSHSPAGCGHDHPATGPLLDRMIEQNPEHFPNGYADLEKLGMIAPQSHGHSHSDDGDILLNPKSKGSQRVLAAVAKRGKPASELKVKPYQRTEDDDTGRRRLQTDSKRYVELLTVNDPGRWQQFLDSEDDDVDTALEEMIDGDISIVNHLSNYYLAMDWGENVGTIQILLSVVVTFSDWSGDHATYMPEALVNSKNDNSGDSCGVDTEPSRYSRTGSGIDYCEASYTDYLRQFHLWRRSGLAPAHDNAQLFSGYDFYDSVIGFANLPGMCIKYTSGGIEQATYDDEYNGNIVAHEMGHNFDMNHDGQNDINECDKEKYIMAAIGSPSYAPNRFSHCSVDYMEKYFVARETTLKCLDNVPYETKYAVCGNGFKEQGESCDCGDDRCELNGDVCCDGDLCQLYGDAECSEEDACCDETCQFKDSGTTCRALDADNGCDMSAETCTGSSASCPADGHYVEGTECNNPTDASGSQGTGLCYGASCVSLQAQCAETGGLYGIEGSQYGRCDDYGTGDTYPWKSNTCGDLYCEMDNDGDCDTISSQYDVSVGTPCHQSNGDYGSVRQCKGSTCQLSANLLTCKWWSGPWTDCLDADGFVFNCISDEENPTPGNQTRAVKCTYQNNTEVTDGSCDCDEDSEPTDVRVCNNYVCDFCRALSDDTDVCHPNGDCDADKSVCECNYGFEGEFCDVFPDLTWVGVTKRLFRDEYGDKINARADPFGLWNETADDFSTPLAMVGNWTITELTVGDMIGIRWNTTGDIQELAVGWTNLGSEGDSVGLDDTTRTSSWSWPTYLGTADDKQDCDSEDWQMIRSDCDDFTFQIPMDTEPGYYQIVVKFNNNFTVYSEELTVRCNDYWCNSAGHGHCVNNMSVCECEENWSGPICSENSCDEWAFMPLDSDAYTVPDMYPTCINNENACDLSYDPTKDALPQLCQNCTNGSLLDPPIAHFTGPYCEVPVDGCGSLDEVECDEEWEYCQWVAADVNANGGVCVYAYCNQFPQRSCNESISDELREEIEDGEYINGTNETMSLEYVNHTWECQWSTVVNPSDESKTLSYCAKKTCGELEEASETQCKHSTLRRTFDKYSSICDAWFCECSTALSDTGDKTGDSAKWFQDSSYVEISSYLEAEDFDKVTCAECDLECKHGATANEDCTECANNCPFEKKPFVTGTLCQNLYWVIDMRVFVPWQIANAYKKQEFEALFLQDFAYLLNVDASRLGIWQMKGDATSTIVYWTYSFVSDASLDMSTQRQLAQANGGELFINLKNEVKKEGSPVYRGFITNATDNSYRMEYCLPYYQECDPDQQFDFLKWFLISLGCGFGFQILAVLIYRLFTHRRRDSKYEQRVDDVRKAQRALMAQKGAEAKRVGFRDVPRSRARQISKAKREEDEKEQKKLKQRAKMEKEMHRRMSRDKRAQKDSEVELGGISNVADEEYYSDSEHADYDAMPAEGGGYDGGPGNGGRDYDRGDAPAAYNPDALEEDVGDSQPPLHMLPLPPGWKQYYNDEHIPYYYNTASGETTWRHPAEMGY